MSPKILQILMRKLMTKVMKSRKERKRSVTIRQMRNRKKRERNQSSYLEDQRELKLPRM